MTIICDFLDILAYTNPMKLIEFKKWAPSMSWETKG